MTVPRVVISAVAVAAALVPAAPASAAITAEVKPGQVSITGSESADDAVLSTGDDGQLTVRSGSGATPGAGCTAVAGGLRCDLTGVTRISVELLGGNDVLDASRVRAPSDGSTPLVVWVRAGEGNDWVTGGDGDDVLYGGPGRDGLLGGDGQDVLKGDANADVLDGGPGPDLLSGDDGPDLYYAVDGDADDVRCVSADTDRAFGEEDDGLEGCEDRSFPEFDASRQDERLDVARQRASADAFDANVTSDETVPVIARCTVVRGDRVVAEATSSPVLATKDKEVEVTCPLSDDQQDDIENDTPQRGDGTTDFTLQVTVISALTVGPAFSVAEHTRHLVPPA